MTSLNQSETSSIIIVLRHFSDKLMKMSANTDALHIMLLIFRCDDAILNLWQRILSKINYWRTTI